MTLTLNEIQVLCMYHVFCKPPAEWLNLHWVLVARTNLSDRGFLKPIPGSFRYEVTDKGAVFCDALTSLREPLCTWRMPT